MSASGSRTVPGWARSTAPSISYHHLVNVAQWHVSDDNYVAARAAVVNAHHKHPMAAIWDDGTTASSDGQYFRAGGRASGGGTINAKYGIDPGFVFYNARLRALRPVPYAGDRGDGE
jgi:TnpA family transposase